MKKGLFVGNFNVSLDESNQNKASLKLLANNGNSEVMMQEIKAGSSVFLEPSNVIGGIEFYYILSGRLSLHIEDETKILCEGDYFYATDLEISVELKPITDIKILVFSTEPVYDDLSKSISELTTLAHKVEQKDMYTHSHIQRVKEYSAKIAYKLDLSNEQIENIMFAALFHDIGKINIPDHILKKEGKLTDVEYSLVKNHPKDGHDIMEHTHYEKIRNIILQHHERVDGKGYPNKLKGNEILLEAKIVNVADCFDAMTTDRPYKKGKTIEESVKELIDGKGTAFDSEIVDIFISILIEEGRYNK